MSDDFDNDSFLVDDSFLREVDNLTAKAAIQPRHPVKTAQSGSTRAAALHVSASSRGWTGPQRNNSSGPSSHSFLKTAPSRSQCTVRPSSSDDYDELSFPAESFAAFDSLQSRPQVVKPIASSRFARTSSGHDVFLQTHLNFRREKQSTKGKRWDRTAFAESGRRIGTDKKQGKSKGKGKRGTGGSDDDDDQDEEEEEEDNCGDALAPYPKPSIDPNAPYEKQRHFPNAATINSYIYPTNRPKRDYQYQIVRACFTDNCLIALPTGLGKTFVAGVVMLNFYRWFPTGKIVFLAPTKPLVNQQIEACQMTCGIPSKDAAVMTGQSVSAKERTRLWEERRVFYCTPQTLDNDLKRGSIDPRDIVLAVFDEAHKASGSYAYTTILAYLTAHHPFFRVLALTATPGADVPRVQAVVDALHISRIEIREAEAPEIRKYLNDKRTERHCVPMGSVVEGFRDRWSVLMKPHVTKLVEKEILTDRDLDIKRLKPFRLTAKRMDIARDRNTGLKWCLGSLQSLERMARAMGLLLEFSIGMFHTILCEIAGGSTSTGKKVGTKGGANSMRNNYEFQKLLRDVEAEMNYTRTGEEGKTKADRHPKMNKTLELLLDHFTQAAENERVYGIENDTRAMVFCSFRDCVMEIVEMLNDHSDLLRATKFVGQSQGKQEQDKGFNQKEQKKTIQEFKEGKFNILVSTSIGEEGLDIGEVDFVVIYDMPKQSIKLLQRVGRTGRKRDGKVHVLMSEGREDANWDTAQQTHREIQEEILHSRNLELFEDVEPLLPYGNVLDCVEQEMPVDPWDPADQKLRRRLPSSSDRSGVKSAVKEQRGHEIPEGAHEGFESVAKLLKAAGKSIGSGKRKKRERSPIESEDEAEEGTRTFHDPLHSSQSTGKSPTKKPRKAVSRPRKSKARKKAIAQIAQASAETEEQRQYRKEKEEKEAFNRSALDFFNTEGPVRHRSVSPLMTPPSSPLRQTPVMTHPPMSSNPGECMPRTQGTPIRTSKLTPRTAQAAGFSQVAAMDLSWEDEKEAMLSTPAALNQSVQRVRHIGLARPSITSNHAKSADAMPPPPIPVNRLSSPATNASSLPEASPFPIRRVRRRPQSFAMSSAEKPPALLNSVESPMLPPNRLRRRHATRDSSSPVVERSVRGRDQSRVPAERVGQFLDLDVDVSGSASSDEPSSDVESESDRVFANDFQPTQAPKGYNQRAIYLAGLSTQEAPKAGLTFKSVGDRHAFLAKARKPVLLTDDEEDGEESENEYQLGSFVCPDEDVSFETQSEPMSCS